MLISVGSTNPVKVGAVQEVAAALFANARVRGVEAESGVGDQPRSDEETLRGAEARARAALPEGEGLGVGIESGVARVGGLLYGFTWVVVVDAGGRVGRACSARFQIPEPAVRELERGAELDEAMRRVTGVAGLGRDGGAMGLVTGGRVTRQAAMCQALFFAFAAFAPGELPGPGAAPIPR